MLNDLSAFFLDTNVLVYAYDPADAAKHTRALAVLTRLGTQQRGALSAQVLSEFVVTVARKITSPLTLAEAEQRVTNYMRSWGVTISPPVSSSKPCAGLGSISCPIGIA
jgi:predicted nucleic acid-binding protein